jgi:hypothetical protein
MWVRPKQIIHESLFWYLLLSVDFLNIFNSEVSILSQSAMHNKNFSVNHMSDRQAFEKIQKQQKSITAVFVNYLSLKTIHCIKFSGFVISPVEKKTLGTKGFKGQKNYHDFHRKRASIHKISIKKIRSFLSRKSLLVENVDQVVELTVDVPTDNHFLGLI